MSSFIPHASFSATIPDYEGIHLDAFFFVRTVVGLPATPPADGEDDHLAGFSLPEVTTI
jgi:hypothetical protein